MLDALAQRYGTRPSRFVPGLNPFQALTVDYMAANEGWKQELEHQRKAERRRG